LHAGDLGATNDVSREIIPAGQHDSRKTRTYCRQKWAWWDGMAVFNILCNETSWYLIPVSHCPYGFYGLYQQTSTLQPSTMCRLQTDDGRHLAYQYGKPHGGTSLMILHIA